MLLIRTSLCSKVRFVVPGFFLSNTEDNYHAT